MEGQLTIFDWQQMKEDIRRKLQETAENFVYIGHKLRQIEEMESYKHDGVSSIYEFAEKEYGLTRTVTQRFMAINAKFSVEGNSTELLPQYKEFGSSKLQEMLNLSEEDCELLTAKATVKEIRDLKAFNRQQGTEELEEMQETLNAVMKMALENDPAEEITRQQAELINPSEFASHTKGVIYLFMYEYDRGVAYKSLVTNIITKWSWQDFVAEIVKIYCDSYGPDTWCNFYGPVVDTVEVKKEEKTPEKPENTKSEPVCDVAQKEEENEEREDDKQVSEEKETDGDDTEEFAGDENCSGQEYEQDCECEAEPAAVVEEQEPDRVEDAPAEAYEGTVIENPYFALQKEAEELADQISHAMYMYERMIIPAEDMDKVIEKVNKLSAVTGQMILLAKDMGEESYNE